MLSEMQAKFDFQAIKILYSKPLRYYNFETAKFYTFETAKTCAIDL